MYLYILGLILIKMTCLVACLLVRLFLAVSPSHHIHIPDNPVDTSISADTRQTHLHHCSHWQGRAPPLPCPTQSKESTPQVNQAIKGRTLFPSQFPGIEGIPHQALSTCQPVNLSTCQCCQEDVIRRQSSAAFRIWRLLLVSSNSSYAKNKKEGNQKRADC